MSSELWLPYWNSKEFQHLQGTQSSVAHWIPYSLLTAWSSVNTVPGIQGTKWRVYPACLKLLLWEGDTRLLTLTQWDQGCALSMNMALWDKWERHWFAGTAESLMGERERKRETGERDWFELGWKEWDEYSWWKGKEVSSWLRKWTASVVSAVKIQNVWWGPTFDALLRSLDVIL